MAVNRTKLAITYIPICVFCDTEFALAIQVLGYGPETRNVDSPLVHKKLLRLDVPVNAASRVHFFNRFNHLHSDVSYDVLEYFFRSL